METVQIRLPKRQLHTIDARIRSGAYRSRSEAIRDMLQRMELFSTFHDLQEIVENEQIDKSTLRRELTLARRSLAHDYR